MTHPMQKVADAAIGVTAGGTGIAVWMDWIQGTAATVAAVVGAIIGCLTLYRMLRNGKRGQE
jgi:hypothetical protein